MIPMEIARITISGTAILARMPRKWRGARTTVATATGYRVTFAAYANADVAASLFMC